MINIILAEMIQQGKIIGTGNTFEDKYMEIENHNRRDYVISSEARAGHGNAIQSGDKPHSLHLGQSSDHLGRHRESGRNG